MASGSTPSKVATWVDEKIEGGDIVIFSKSYCPYCRRAKNFFAQNYPDTKPLVFELDHDGLDTDEEGVPVGSQIQGYLAEKTGQSTVPNVFVGGLHIGGSSELAPKQKQITDLLNKRDSTSSEQASATVE